MPYWPQFNRLSSHIERVLDAFDGTHIHAHTLVFSPHGGLPDAAMLDRYQKLLSGLMAAHTDYIISDTDALDGIEPANGVLRIKDLDIRVIIVPPMRVVEKPFDAALRRFEAAGGVVLRLNANNDVEAVLNKAKTQAPDTLGIRPVSGPAESVHSVIRMRNGKALAFLINTASVGVEVELTGERSFAVKDTVRHSESTQRLNGRRLKLQPYESVLLEENAEQETRALTERTIAVGG